MHIKTTQSLRIPDFHHGPQAKLNPSKKLPMARLVQMDKVLVISEKKSVDIFTDCKAPNLKRKIQHPLF
jgi:hypothetical protein